LQLESGSSKPLICCLTDCEHSSPDVRSRPPSSSETADYSRR
jgi:hypothetical protein